MYVRSYTLKGRYLFLSLMADGGIYEFAPLSHAEGAGVVPSSATSSSTTSSASLENTYWKLTHLPDAEVNMSSRKQEPHLVLNSETHRVSGAGGCNRLTGSYKLNADQITFSQTAVTTMACVKGMDTEKSFLDALKRVQGWRVTGQQLEFFDASGNLLATFELRHMK
jgi:heat shock protein HslJ